MSHAAYILLKPRMATDLEAGRPPRWYKSRKSPPTSRSSSSEPSIKSEFSEAPPSPFKLWNPTTWSRKMKWAAATVAVLCIVPAIAVPLALRDTDSGTSLGQGMPLRVMPLGASITYGYLSTDGNGYRSTVRSKLTGCGNKVNMVGSRQNGTMVDNDVEGWPGFRISQVYAKANASVPAMLPNVVLINVGTNDCLQTYNISTAPDRMRSLIDGVLDMSPRATIVLSTLIYNTKATANACMETVSAGYRTLVTDYQAAGQPVVLAEMRGSDGPQAADMVDQTHPNDVGYAKMGAIFYRAVQDASSRGYLQTAEAVAGIPDDGA